jgi:hypothetical protein
MPYSGLMPSMEALQQAVREPLDDDWPCGTSLVGLQVNGS